MDKISDKLKIPRENFYLLLFTYFSFFTTGIMNTAVGSILSAIKAEYNLDYSLSGSILSTFQIGSLAAVIIVGFLPYKIGRKKSTLILFSGMVLGVILLTLTDKAIFIIASFFITGIGKGVLSNICNVTISEISEKKTRSLNMLHACFALGSLLTPFIVILTVNKFGWKGLPWFIGILSIICFLFLLSSNMPSEPTVKNKENDKSYLKSKSFWLITFIIFFYLCAEVSIIGWFVTYFKDTGIMSQNMAEITTFVVWIMVMVGRVIIALVSDKINKNKLLIFLSISKALFFILMIATNNIIFIIIGLMGIGLSMSGIYPTTIATMEPKFAGSTLAMGTCIAVSTLGAIIMPRIVGIVADYAGIKWGIGAILIAIFFLIALTIIKYKIEKVSQ